VLHPHTKISEYADFLKEAIAVVMLRGGDPRDCRQRGSARGQMEKISAGKFHC
jgi:hypothetical protein